MHSLQQGLLDDAVWLCTQAEKRMLPTTDKGFVEHRDKQHFGILIVRLRQPNRQRIHARIMSALRQFSPNEWLGLLVVMRDTVQSVYRAPKT